MFGNNYAQKWSRKSTMLERVVTWGPAVAVLVWFTGVLLSCSFTVLIIYALIHFIKKYW